MRALLQQDLRADNHEELINNSDQRGRKSRGRQVDKPAKQPMVITRKQRLEKEIQKVNNGLERNGAVTLQ